MKRYVKQLIAAAAIAALTPAVTHAQNCKSVKESKDAFSGEPVKKAEQIIGPVFWNWQLTLMQKGEKYFIGMRIIQGGDIRYVLGKGEKIMIKLENEKFVELEMDKDYPPVANVSGAGITTLWLVNSEVDVKMIKRLSHSPITDIKVVIQGVDIILDKDKLKSKQTQNIMDAANCILGTTYEK